MRSASSYACSRTSSLMLLEVIATLPFRRREKGPVLATGRQGSTHQVGPETVGQANCTFATGLAEHHPRACGDMQFRCVLEAGVEEGFHALDRALVLEEVLGHRGIFRLAEEGDEGFG